MGWTEVGLCGEGVDGGMYENRTGLMLRIHWNVVQRCMYWERKAMLTRVKEKSCKSERRWMMNRWS